MKKRNIACVMVLTLLLAIAGMSLMTTCKKIAINTRSTQIIDGE